MTDDQAELARARECLASAYEAAGYHEEADAFRAGDWTCHDHPALAAMLAFAQPRADVSAAVEAWQPIETAPRDRTRILACWTGERSTDRCEYAVVYWLEAAKSWREAGESVTAPSHWQPLPEPPQPHPPTGSRP